MPSYIRGGAAEGIAALILRNRMALQSIRLVRPAAVAGSGSEGEPRVCHPRFAPSRGTNHYSKALPPARSTTFDRSALDKFTSTAWPFTVTRSLP